MNGEQIGVATAIQWQTAHLLAANDLAQLRIRRLDLGSVVGDGHRLIDSGQFQHYVQLHRAADVNRYISSFVRSEVFRTHHELILAHGNHGKRERALGISLSGLFDASRSIC